MLRPNITPMKRSLWIVCIAALVLTARTHAKNKNGQI